VLVLRTLGAPERRRLRGRRPHPVEESEPEPVPTARATVVRAHPFDSTTEAGAWLSRLRAEPDEAEAELTWAVRLLNRARHARRTAAADPYAGDVSPGHALVARVGYGSGEAVAEGRFAAALQLPSSAGRRGRRSMEAPDERFAAILGGREQPLVAEELVLRARADLDAGRAREAALEARTALAALQAQLEPAPEDDLQAHDGALDRAAARALEGDLEPAAAEQVERAVADMERALRRRRLTRGG
jgi:hypothetical protein